MEPPQPLHRHLLCSKVLLKRSPVTSRPPCCCGYPDDREVGAVSSASHALYKAWLQARAPSERAERVDYKEHEPLCCFCYHRINFVLLLLFFLLRTGIRIVHGRDWGWMWPDLLQDEGDSGCPCWWGTRLFFGLCECKRSLQSETDINIFMWRLGLAERRARQWRKWKQLLWMELRRLRNWKAAARATASVLSSVCLTDFCSPQLSSRKGRWAWTTSSKSWCPPLTSANSEYL